MSFCAWYWFHSLEIVRRCCLNTALQLCQGRRDARPPWYFTRAAPQLLLSLLYNSYGIAYGCLCTILVRREKMPIFVGKSRAAVKTRGCYYRSHGPNPSRCTRNVVLSCTPRYPRYTVFPVMPASPGRDSTPTDMQQVQGARRTTRGTMRRRPNILPPQARPRVDPPIILLSCPPPTQPPGLSHKRNGHQPAGIRHQPPVKYADWFMSGGPVWQTLRPGRGCGGG